MKFRFLLSILALLLISTTVLAQAGDELSVDTVGSIPGISVSTSVDKADIYIGDLVTYKIEIVHDSGITLIPPPLGANLGAFDVKDYQQDQIEKLDNGQIKSTSTFVLSTFTTGNYVIPALPVLFTLADGTHKAVLTEAIPIKVNSLLLNSSDSADIKPLKAPYEFLRDWSKLLRWAIPGALLFLVVLLFLWRWWRHRKEKPVSVDPRKPWEIAFADMADLQQKRLPSEGKYREHYFLLTDIARAYLGRMYAFGALDMTTEELLEHMQDIQLPGELYQNFSRFARAADLVKFATFIPDEERLNADFTFVHGMVETIRIEFERRVAELARQQQEAGKR